MASDEVKLKAKEYCDRYRNHSIDSLIYAIRPEPQSFAENIYVDGYTQGRADAWRWIPVSERLPKKDGVYLVNRQARKLDNGMYAYSEYPITARQFKDGKFLSGQVITHWLPIKLPGGEND